MLYVLPTQNKSCLVLYPTTLKSVGYYVIPSVQKFESECPSVGPSVSASFPLSILRIF